MARLSQAYVLPADLIIPGYSSSGADPDAPVIDLTTPLMRE